MTDDALKNLLRTAIPPLASENPTRDLWPALAERITALPSWSWVDFVVAAGLGIALAMFPTSLFLLAYLL